MKRRHLLLFGLLLGVSLPGFAQSNTFMDSFLEAKEADYAGTAYFVLSASGALGEAASPAEAMELLSRQDWGLRPVDGAKTVTLGEFAHLAMRAFGLPGGVMYRLFPGPRYAAREIAYLGFVVDKTSPYRKLSGEEVLRILGAMLSFVEERS